MHMAKSSEQETKLSLIKEITAAFDGVDREDGVTLHEAMVIDSYGSLAERAEARKKDTETKWQDVPDKDIRDCDGVLSFLDDKGMRYYIPAYLIWYLNNIDQKSSTYCSNTFDSIPFHLTYQEGKFKRFELFTQQQREAIAHYLIFEAERKEKSEEKYLRASLYQGGLDKAAVEKVIKEYDFQDNEFRQAIRLFWNAS